MILMVIKQVFAAEFPFLCEVLFFLRLTSTKLTVKI